MFDLSIITMKVILSTNSQRRKEIRLKTQNCRRTTQNTSNQKENALVIRMRFTKQKLALEMTPRLKNLTRSYIKQTCNNHVLNVLNVLSQDPPKDGLSGSPRHRLTLPPSWLPWPRHWIYRKQEWMGDAVMDSPNSPMQIISNHANEGEVRGVFTLILRS